MFAFDKPLTWVIILVIVLLIFGAGKLPDIGKSLGKSIKEFKDETTNGMNKDNVTTTTVAPPVSTTATMSTAGTAVNGNGNGEASIRRRIIKHPDGREEIIEERV